VKQGRRHTFLGESVEEYTRKAEKSISMSSGVKRVAAPPAPGGVGQAKKPGGASSANGSGPAPLTYSSGEPSDDVNMNEVDDKVTLDVWLPSGKASSITVDSK
ncbi:hypothetical protein BaRGS_00009389, partial [Batillaria attramentaria]